MGEDSSGVGQPNGTGENGQKLGPPRIWLAEVAREVEQEVGGQIVSEDEVARKKGQGKELAAAVEVAASMGMRHESLKAKY
jgi:hypothetical protein